MQLTTQSSAPDGISAAKRARLISSAVRTRLQTLTLATEPVRDLRGEKQPAMHSCFWPRVSEPLLDLRRDPDAHQARFVHDQRHLHFFLGGAHRSLWADTCGSTPWASSTMVPPTDFQNGCLAAPSTYSCRGRGPGINMGPGY